MRRFCRHSAIVDDSYTVLAKVWRIRATSDDSRVVLASLCSSDFRQQLHGFGEFVLEVISDDCYTVLANLRTRASSDV